MNRTRRAVLGNAATLPLVAALGLAVTLPSVASQAPIDMPAPTPEAYNLVSARLVGLIAAYRAAWQTFEATCNDIDSVRLGREPTKAAWRRWNRASRAEDRAVTAICEYRADDAGSQRESAVPDQVSGAFRTPA